MSDRQSDEAKAVELIVAWVRRNREKGDPHERDLHHLLESIYQAGYDKGESETFALDEE